jgi:hypothetical protein
LTINIHNILEENMLKELIRLANTLDEKGLKKEADELDVAIRRLASAEYDEKGWLPPSDEDRRDREEIGEEKTGETGNLEALIRDVVEKEVQRQLMAINQAYIQEAGGMGGFQIGPPTNPQGLTAEAKSKPTTKQLKHLDLDGDKEITSKDFELLGKKNKGSKDK